MKYVKPEMEIMEFDCVPITQISTVETPTDKVPSADIGDVDW